MPGWEHTSGMPVEYDFYCCSLRSLCRRLEATPLVSPLLLLVLCLVLPGSLCGMCVLFVGQDVCVCVRVSALFSALPKVSGRV